LGIFIVSGAFTLSNPTLPVILVYCLMLLVTNIRADLEEGMLEKIHPEYKAYQERTKRYMQLIY
jgi:protein-S-isoprenylcysteine O-methyltransferase Ste14